MGRRLRKSVSNRLNPFLKFSHSTLFLKLRHKQCGAVNGGLKLAMAGVGVDPTDPRASDSLDKHACSVLAKYSIFIVIELILYVNVRPTYFKVFVEG